MKFIKRILSINLLLCFLFSFIPKGMANSVIDPLTKQHVLVDSIISKVIQFAPFYETIVSDYRADLYIKSKLNVKKKNFMFRYLPSMFRMKRGVRQYLVESHSDLHYTAPNIYDQKVKATIGTASGGRRYEGTMLEYFNINIYAATLLYDRILSPLAKNGQKYYKYSLDTITGTPHDVQYKVRFIPKSKSDQLVGGYMIVSANVWSVREIRFSGRSELLLFENHLKMGEVGEENEFLPVCYDVDASFRFMGNRVDGSYQAVLNYSSIKLREKKEGVKGKREHDLSESFSLKTDTNAFFVDTAYFAQYRPIELTQDEKVLYQQHNNRNDTLRHKKLKSRVFWGEVGDLLLSDYNVNLSNLGNVRCSPIINPFLMSYSASNGLSYRQQFKYSRLFSGDRLLRLTPKLGYNFTQKEFYWSLFADYNYWPSKQGSVRIDVGNGNRIYSSDVLDELKEMPDSLFDFNQIHLDYFKDLYVTVQYKMELINGLGISVGFSTHKRTAIEASNFVSINPTAVDLPQVPAKYKDTYISFAPRVRLEWTPGMDYYMNGRRKMNYHSAYPTFSVDWERGIKGILNSTGKYERLEFDLQHHVPLGLMRNIYYRFGFGAFTNQEELYFVDFSNFSRSNLPVGWNDDIGGVFQLLDRRWYNSSRNYIRGNFTYEAPFLVLRNLVKYTRYVQNERLYANFLRVPHLNPYLELGYGIGTHVFDFGLFVGSENWKYSQIGCKFTFELFNR